MFIKNKFRDVPQKISHKPYEPEHKKLGITPQVAQSTMVRSATVPRNIRVNSGQNEESSWMPKQKEIVPENKIIDNNDEVIIQEVRERSFINQSYEDGINKNTPIAYDEVPDYTKKVVALEKNDENVGQFSDVEIGEFVLIFENEILGAGTYDEVTDAIEKILLADKDGSISPKSLIVFKRMQIMTGVLIKDV